MSSWCGWVWVRCAIVVTGAAGAAANTASTQSDRLQITGHVGVQTAAGERRVAGEMVTVHRLAGAASGPVDSARTNGTGQFSFTINADTGAMYLASARYGGIAYFAEAIRLGDPVAEREIVVFDTSSVGRDVRVAGRHIIVSAAGADGWRQMADVYELENDSIVTRVSRGRGRPVFATTVPAGARNVRTEQGDFRGGGVEVTGTTVQLYAAVPPGVRQLVLVYEVPPAVFPADVSLPHGAELLELLFEESGGTGSGVPLESLGSVAVDGRHYVRYLGRKVAPGTTVRLNVSAVASPKTGATFAPYLALLGVGVLVVSWVLWRRAQQRRLHELADELAMLQALATDAATHPEARAAFADQYAARYAAAAARLAPPTSTV